VRKAQSSRQTRAKAVQKARSISQPAIFQGLFQFVSGRWSVRYVLGFHFGLVFDPERVGQPDKPGQPKECRKN
jgi:high-affinity nickel permease